MSITAVRLFRIERGEERQRLDRTLVQRLAHLKAVSRTTVQGWIEGGWVRVNGRPARRAADRLAIGDVIELSQPAAPPLAEPPPEPMALAVLYEDEHLLAVDKPAGLLVHPTPHQRAGTLWNGLLHLARDWARDRGEENLPGLVHRLDRDTSGVLLVAKNRRVLPALMRALRSPSAGKEYLALVYGEVAGSKGRIDLEIGRDPAESISPGRPRRWSTTPAGKPASTLWERLAESPRAPLTLLACRLLTGRTHQIRVHLAALGWPIVGDPLYGEPRHRGIDDPALAAHCGDFPRQALHARRLAFVHPLTRERLELTAPLPADLRDLLVAAQIPHPALC